MTTAAALQPPTPDYEYFLEFTRVFFPFNAYECQLQFMRQVLQTLQNRQNALLESPTGTGKTLCLLCSTLAWRLKLAKAVKLVSANKASQQDLDSSDWGSSIETLTSEQSQEVPKIYYASRTHSQLSQVLSELKKTRYSNVRVCVLGSREQACINPQVQQFSGSITVQNTMCRTKVARKQCEFHSNISAVSPLFKNAGLMDIEEIHNFGMIHKACPYYLTRENIENAELILLPYNYILDRKTRQSQGIDLRNAVVIFDEAHNLEGSCGDATSFDLNVTCLRDCEAEINQLIASTVSQPSYSGKFCIEDYRNLVIQLRDLSNKINSHSIPASIGYLVFEGIFMFDLLESAGINFSTISPICDLIEEAIQLYSSKHVTSTNLHCTLPTLLSCLKIVFRDFRSEEDAQSMTKSQLSKYYKIYLQETTNAHARTTKILGYWCFNPGVVMKELVHEAGVRNIILTSGTLSPLESFAQDLQVPFQNTLENSHIIAEDQVMIGVLPMGPSNRSLNSSFSHRDSDAYKVELGHSILNFLRIVPGGCLVFFPSYSALDSAIYMWKKSEKSNGNFNNDSSIWNQMSKLKKCFIEPKEKNNFANLIEDFYSSSCKTPGAVFFGVCRGKLSEGVDFSDSRARAVFITGIPFPAVKDPKIELKKKYLDDQFKNKESQLYMLSGSEWYLQQASRAVNQAIGRVIRHRKDFGIILLCDERFSSSRNISQLSKWLRPKVRVFTSFQDATSQTSVFFKNTHTFSLNVPEHTQNSVSDMKTGDCSAVCTSQSICSVKNNEYNNINTQKAIPNYNFNAPKKNLHVDTSLTPKRSLLDSLQKNSKEYAIHSKNFCIDKSSFSTVNNAFINSSSSVVSIEKMGTMEKLRRTKEFVSKAKSLLTKQEYETFENLFKCFSKEKDISINDLLRQIALFLHSCEKIQLFFDFKIFIKEQNFEAYEKILSELMHPKFD